MIRRAIARCIRFCGLRVFALRRMPWGIDAWNDVKRLTRTDPVRTAFDVGANIGATTRQLLRDYPRARVFAFEPVPDTFAQLQRNLGRHRRVSLHNLALGPADETRAMHLYPNSKVSSFVPDAPLAVAFPRDSRPIHVPVTTLDAFCETHGIDTIDLLKVDTEGFDLEVLRGARELLARRRIRFVYVEFNEIRPSDKSTGGVFLDLHDLLVAAGLRLVAIYTDWISPHNNFFSVRNALFARPTAPDPST